MRAGLHWYPSHSHDLAMQVAAMPLCLGNFNIHILPLVFGGHCRIHCAICVSIRVRICKAHLRIYGVFSLDCVIQTLLLMTGQCFVNEAVSPKMLDMMRHMTEEPGSAPQVC